MSWNLWWRFGDRWGEPQPRIVKRLRAAAPAVAGLQEVWAADDKSQADVIADALGMHAAFAGAVTAPGPSATHRSFEPVVLMATLDHPAGPLHVFTTAAEWEPSFADDHLAQTRRLAELVSDPALGASVRNIPSDEAARPADRLRAGTQHRA